jgi:hypothetical protein
MTTTGREVPEGVCARCGYPCPLPSPTGYVCHGDGDHRAPEPRPQQPSGTEYRDALNEVQPLTRSLRRDRDTVALHVELWDRINAYMVACGGRESSVSVARMKAVAGVEGALIRLCEAWTRVDKETP